MADDIVKCPKCGTFRDSQSNERKYDALMKQARALRNENQILRNEIRILRSSETPGGSEVDVLPVVEQRYRYSNVEDAVYRASRTLLNVRFFSDAFESSRKSQFRRPQEIYEALAVLDRCAIEIEKGSLGTSVTEWLEQRGITYTPHESERVGAMYRSERIFSDRTTGDSKYMPAHIKIGGGEVRIHVIWVAEERKWWIGHVGIHLPVAKYG